MHAVSLPKACKVVQSTGLCTARRPSKKSFVLSMVTWLGEMYEQEESSKAQLKCKAKAGSGGHRY